MTFKSKGKCSKGAACNFLHVPREKKKIEMHVSSDAAAEQGTVKAKGICTSFKKKGKCRKGDRCPYSHDLSATKAKAADAVTDKKRKRIDGKELVERRTKQLNTKVVFDD